MVEANGDIRICLPVRATIASMVEGELTILTTEHYTLQMARQACLQDMQGRASLFLTAVSGIIVAVGFLVSADRLRFPLVISIIALLSALWILGILTFVRITQIGVEDEIIAFGIARIRHRYLEITPELKGTFVRSVHDDMAGVTGEMGITQRWWQLLMPTSVLVSFIASVVFGAQVVLVVTAFFSVNLASALGAGVLAAIASLIAFSATARATWTSQKAVFPSRFPSPSRSNDPANSSRLD